MKTGTTTIRSVTETMKDFYPLSGTRIKQYVVDTRREHAWAAETAPRFNVDPHEDNCGSCCRNVGTVPWTYLNHDSCYVCGDMYELARETTAVVAWLAEKAKRPPIEPDETKLSDEIEPDHGKLESPLFAMLRRKP